MIEGLVTRAQAGEGVAWAELYEHYRLDIFRFMRARLTTSVEDVEDLTEETFIKAFANLGKYTYRPGAGFRSWLYTIARNVRHDFLRAAQRRGQDRTMDAPEDDQRPHLELAQAPTEDIDTRVDVQGALAALPADYRRVVELRHLEGLTAEETATALGITLEAVKKRHVRAMDALREALSVESAA